MKNLYKQLIEQIGEDPNRSGLIDTPKRAAKALEFLTKGYHEDIDLLINNALFDSNCNEMVMIKDIELFSLCEHHLLPFYGKCHVGYIPKQKVLGLSKFARIVDHFSRRLQLQEHLTMLIADYIQKVTEAQGVAVIIEAKHLCMMMRGVEKQNSYVTTSAMKGCFLDSGSTRNEFFQLLKL